MELRSDKVASKEQARRVKKQKTKNKLIGERFDFYILMIVALLLIFGLLMIYSTSSYNALNEKGSAVYYLEKQALAISGGLFFMVIAMFFPMKWIRGLAEIIYFISVISVFLVLTGLGASEGGATRWIYIGPISVQPSELVKIGTIVLMAALLCKFNSREYNKWKMLGGLTIPSGIAAAIIFFVTNNLSSAIIVVGIAIVMMFVASPNYSKFFISAGVLLLVAVIAVLAIVNIDNSVEGGFRVERVLAWLDPEAYANGKGYQILQSLYAIGSGGIFGKGLGESMQKLGFIPESQNDMIFSIICEELGLCGAFMLLFLFGLLLWRMMLVAMTTKSKFNCLVVVGVIAHIAIQVVLNIAVVTNSIPNTGISLPFISYGGSSVVCLLIEIGLVMNVSRTSKT